ncbi:hypothetical protein Tco_0937971 [Tanacetum coccineum]|uniref:Uncharacterized protein n=1 Tax=Tanacetum coccineum TaxID=301880 RepID=A0ABQ5DFS9_9ASTR
MMKTRYAKHAATKRGYTIHKTRRSEAQWKMYVEISFDQCQPSGLAQMATKGNLRKVIITSERSRVRASSWKFFFRSEKGMGLSPKAKVQVLHTAQLDVIVSSNHQQLTCRSKRNKNFVLGHSSF